MFNEIKDKFLNGKWQARAIVSLMGGAVIAYVASYNHIGMVASWIVTAAVMHVALSPWPKK